MNNKYIPNTFEEIVTKYDITRAGGTRLRVGAKPTNGPELDELFNVVTTNRMAVLKTVDDLRAKAVEAERARMNALLPGLDELNRCSEAWANYKAAVNRQFDSPDGMIKWPEKPQSYADLADKYPKAAAYRRAQSYSMAANYRKSAAGDKAMKAILAGVDYQTAIEEMEHWGDDIDIWQ